MEVIKNKIFFLILCLALVVGCKKDASIYDISEKNATHNKTALKVLNEHSKNAQSFETCIIRSSSTYQQVGGKTQRFALDITIQKDQSILLDIRFLGFPVAKALINPDKVQYYDKINKVYFDGDFSILSQWLGAEVNFNRLQNIFLGQVLDSYIQTKDLKSSVDQGLHKLSSLEQSSISSTYYFEDKNSLLKKEEIVEHENDRNIVISYDSYKKIGKYTTPNQINIQAQQEKVINLDIRYDKVSFNEQINLHYKVPKGYTRITLN